MIGAEAIEAAIARFGTRAVFSLSGAQHSRLLEVLDCRGYRIVGNRSESAVVAGADGYARVTGRPGVALVISGQGIVNAVAGVATAFEAGSPVVVLMARPSFADDEPRDAAYHASAAVVAPVAKWHHEVHRPEALPAAVGSALEIALAGRPGPVVLSIPADFLSAEVAEPPPAAAAPVATRSRPGRAELARAVEAITRSARPVVVAGSGVRWSGAEGLLASFVAEHGLPLLLEGGARGAVADDLVEVYPWALAQTVVHQADVVLVLGCRLSRRLGGGRPPRFSPDATIVQVDREPHEPGRGRPVDVVLAADVGATLEDLAEALAARRYRAGGGGWIRDALATRLAAVGALDDAGPGGLHPIAVGRRLSAGLAGPAIVLGDGADTLNWTLASLRLPAGSSWFDHRLLGSMGICLPLALGAAVGEAERFGALGQPGEDGGSGDGAGAPRPVILVTGDGALGYHLSELETAARCSIPVRVVVSNDGAWGTERNGQLVHLGRAINTTLTKARYDLAAEALGCEGLLATNEPELDAALKRVLDGPGPLLVNVVVDETSGLVRKQQPLLEMIFHDDFALRRAQEP